MNEVGEIPFGGNEYFVEHIKPSLSEHCMFVQCTSHNKLASCMEYVQLVMHHGCIHKHPNALLGTALHAVVRAGTQSQHC